MNLPRRHLLRALPLAASALALARVAGAAATGPAREEIRLGDGAVWLAASARDPATITYVSVHENERTAVEAARRVMDRSGGRLLELRARRQRLVSFTRAGVRYTFDPNRIFTPVGIAKTLRRYGPYSAAADADVAGLARAIVAAVVRDRVFPVVALHNNSGAQYTVESYGSGAALAGDAAEVHVDARARRTDFFLVTEGRAFGFLREQGFSVVLQADAAADDGSLSIYCARERIPYVNVEAGAGQLAQQVRMLEALQGLRG